MVFLWFTIGDKQSLKGDNYEPGSDVKVGQKVNFCVRVSFGRTIEIVTPLTMDTTSRLDPGTS